MRAVNTDAYQVFDETEGNWHIHLTGAEKMIRQVANFKSQGIENHFLYTWCLYHSVLGCFTHPLRKSINMPYNPLTDSLNPENSIVSLSLTARAVIKLTCFQIIGSLGCSVEVMLIIDFVNNLRAVELRGGMETLTPEEQAEHGQRWSEVESRLYFLEQRLDPKHRKQLSEQECTRILRTAELYRLATVLYFQRSSTRLEQSNLVSSCLDQAIAILQSLAVCTSPWPLFVIACEAVTDEHRIIVLKTLDRMDVARHIGNVFVMRTIVESIWKQQDLQADKIYPASLKWWDMIQMDTAMPWFV